MNNAQDNLNGENKIETTGMLTVGNISALDPHEGPFNFENVTFIDNAPLERALQELKARTRLVSVPLDLVESLRDYLSELRSDRHWWETEPRGTYQKEYARMTKDLEQAAGIIRQANNSAQPPCV